MRYGIDDLLAIKASMVDEADTALALKEAL